MKYFYKIYIVCIVLLCPYSYADQRIQDDLVVIGSVCVGLDCVDGENFNFDTIRLKENNVRIRFIDTSTSGSFPTRDWELTANESSNGGLNAFMLQNIDGSTIPVTVVDAVKSHALFINTSDRVGFGTNAPVTQLHVVTGNSPALRLDQDQSAGFSAQAWDVGGNETNFFVRDATNGNKLPLRIQSAAPNASIFVATDGDVGFETTTPDGLFDIAHPSDLNNHALLVSTLGYLGVNIDNGFNPRGLFDVNTTGGESKFLVQSDGKVGIGLSTSGAAQGVFDVQIGGVSKFTVATDGDVSVGAASTTGRFEVFNASNTTALMVDASGNVGINGIDFSQVASSFQPMFKLNGRNGEHNSIQLDVKDTNMTSNIIFTNSSATANAQKWIISSRNNWESTNNSLPLLDDSLAFYNANFNATLSLKQDLSVSFANGASISSVGVYSNPSSRKLKQNISSIDSSDALKAINSLEPVTYQYTADPSEQYAGFIAEDVPEIVANNDRKSLSTMDVVAVLTKVVKDQQATIEVLTKRLDNLESDKK